MELLLDLLLGILLTAIVYMAFPLIRLLINQGKFCEEQAKRIALWNSIVIGAVCLIVSTEVSDGNAVWSGGPAFLYYYINRTILTDKSAGKNAFVAANKNPTPPQTTPVHMSRPPQLSYSDAPPKKCGNYNVMGEELRYVPLASTSSSSSYSSVPNTTNTNPQHRNLFCQNCGNKLPEKVRFCQSCGTKVPGR